MYTATMELTILAPDEMVCESVDPGYGHWPGSRHLHLYCVKGHGAFGLADYAAIILILIHSHTQYFECFEEMMHSQKHFRATVRWSPTDPALQYTRLLKR
jgi:hypothetical protein